MRKVARSFLVYPYPFTTHFQGPIAMVPHLVTALTGPINELEQRVLDTMPAIERRGIDGKVTRGAEKGRGRQRRETKVSDIKWWERNKTKYTVCSSPNTNLESHMVLTWGL